MGDRGDFRALCPPLLAGRRGGEGAFPLFSPDRPLPIASSGDLCYYSVRRYIASHNSWRGGERGGRDTAHERGHVLRPAGPDRAGPQMCIRDRAKGLDAAVAYGIQRCIERAHELGQANG